MRLAERDHFPKTFDCQFGLEGARFIIEARMENPAVVPRLVPTQGILFFQQQQLRSGACLQNAQSGGQAYNAPAHYDKVVLQWEIRIPLFKARFFS